MTQTGVTAETFRNLILDAAVVYLNYGTPQEEILGATNGGATFGFEEFNIRSPEIDGIKGRLAGVSRITRASPRISVSLVEWRLQALRRAFPGCEISQANGYSVITRSQRVIPISDYPANITMVGTQSGTGNPVIMMVKRPMIVNGAEIPTEEDTEATATLEFVGHYDPSNPEEEPWEIRWPLGDSTVLTLSALSIPAGATIAEDAAQGDVIAAISGLSAGSTRSTTNPAFAVSGSNLVVGDAAALSPGVQTFAIVEAISTAGNSPRASSVTVTVTPA